MSVLLAKPEHEHTLEMTNITNKVVNGAAISLQGSGYWVEIRQLQLQCPNKASIDD